jgi:hypothetical protein
MEMGFDGPKSACTYAVEAFVDRSRCVYRTECIFVLLRSPLPACTERCCEVDENWFFSSGLWSWRW